MQESHIKDAMVQYHESTDFINSANLYQDIFLGIGSYTRKDLKILSAICSCFTDVAIGRHHGSSCPMFL